MPDDWEGRLTQTWATVATVVDDASAGAFRARIAALVDELPDGDPRGAFERASANDSTGRSDRAIPLYREALALGLSGERRRRATIQLASSLRNLGQPAESVALLTAELAAGRDHLDDAVRGFLALALVDAGRPVEATSLALQALAPHLPRYQRSLAAYAADLLDQPDDSSTAETDRTS